MEASIEEPDGRINASNPRSVEGPADEQAADKQPAADAAGGEAGCSQMGRGQVSQGGTAAVGDHEQVGSVASESVVTIVVEVSRP